MTEEILARIEAKLDTLIAALAEDDEPAGPSQDLEGNPDPINAGRPRDIDYSTL